MKTNYSILVLPGDGIGIEVTAEALKLLDAVRETSGVDFRVEEIECGGHFYAEHGVEWPEGSFEKCRAADAILLGAVGHEIDGKPVFTQPGRPYPTSQLAGYAQVIGNRNPARSLRQRAPGEALSRRSTQGARTHDVRLGCGPRGLRGGPERTRKTRIRARRTTCPRSAGGPGRETPIRITESCAKRVIRFAFELARRRATERAGKPAARAPKVTCVGSRTSSARIATSVTSSRAWARASSPTSSATPRTSTRSACGQVRNPEWFDVVVAPNLVGDVISDLGSATQGEWASPRAATSAIDTACSSRSHGSAPRHAGRNKANPIAAILALKMLLDWLGRRHDDRRLVEAAEHVESAVASVLRSGNALTYDLATDGVGVTCSACGEAVARELSAGRERLSTSARRPPSPVLNRLPALPEFIHGPTRIHPRTHPNPSADPPESMRGSTRIHAPDPPIPLAGARSAVRPQRVLSSRE